MCLRPGLALDRRSRASPDDPSDKRQQDTSTDVNVTCAAGQRQQMARVVGQVLLVEIQLRGSRQQAPTSDLSRGPGQVGPRQSLQ